MHILLMDDEVHVRTITKELLEHLGHTVTDVPEGGAALSAFRDSLSAGKPYDLVILDISVTCGLGGKDTLKRLRAIDPNVKVFVSSGYTDESSEKEYAALGFDDFIPKPLSIDGLQSSLAKIGS
jgi:CheY-like chemotaxis protein